MDKQVQITAAIQARFLDAMKALFLETPANQQTALLIDAPDQRDCQLVRLPAAHPEGPATVDLMIHLPANPKRSSQETRHESMRLAAHAIQRWLAENHP